MKRYGVIYSKSAPAWLVDMHKAMMSQLEEPAISQGLPNGIVKPTPIDVFTDGLLDNDLAVLERLVCDDNGGLMRPVWKLLQGKEADMDDAAPWWLYSTCVNAYKWPEQERQAQREKDKARTDLAKHLHKAAKLLRGNPELDLSLVEALSVTAISEEWVAEVHNDLRTTPSLEETPPVIAGNKEWFSEKGQAGLYDFNVSRTMGMLANRAEAQIGVAVEKSKPNITRSHAAVFVGRVAAAMKERFGRPCQEETASIAQAVFGDNSIDEKFVQNNSK